MSNDPKDEEALSSPYPENEPVVQDDESDGNL